MEAPLQGGRGTPWVGMVIEEAPGTGSGILTMEARVGGIVIVEAPGEVVCEPRCRKQLNMWLPWIFIELYFC